MVGGSNEITSGNYTLLLDAYPTWESFATRFIPVAFYVDRYVTLVYYAVGFPGNIISFVVWTSRRVYRGNSAAMYLAAVSLNDIVVLIFALVRDLARSWQITLYLTPGACEVRNTLTPAVQYASPLFVLGFTVERWLAICRPFAIDRICSIRRAIYICVLITVGTILICSGNAFIFFTEEYFCDKRSPGSTIVNVYLSLLEILFSGVVPLLVLLFNCMVIREMARVHRANRHLANVSKQFTVRAGDKTANKRPPLLRAWCSLCLNKELFRSYEDEVRKTGQTVSHMHTKREYCLGAKSKENKAKTVENLGNSKCGNSGVIDQNDDRRKSARERRNQLSHSKGNPSFRSTTMMLLIVSFYMIVTTLLGGLIYLLHQTNEPPNMKVTESELEQDPQWTRYLSIMNIKAFGDEVALSYYAFGFIIYYSTGQAFRHRVHYILRHLLNRCGFQCDAILRLGISDDFEFVANRRRAIRGQIARASIRHTVVSMEESPLQVTNPVQQTSPMGCSGRMSTLSGQQSTQVICGDTLKKQHHLNHAAQNSSPFSSENKF